MKVHYDIKQIKVIKIVKRGIIIHNKLKNKNRRKLHSHTKQRDYESRKK